MVSGRAVASMNELGVGQSSKNAEIALCCAGQPSRRDSSQAHLICGKACLAGEGKRTLVAQEETRDMRRHAISSCHVSCA